MNLKFYITHYTPLIDRKLNVIKQLNENNITDFSFINIYDRENLPELVLKKFDSIKLNEISLFMKHIHIYQQTKYSQNYTVVLEDDFILKTKNPIDDIKYLINEANDNGDWDIIFSGECCNLHYKNIINNKKLYKTNSSRGMGMYILNLNTSRKIIEIFDSEKIIIKPIDHWFNDILNKYNMTSYWSEPTLVLQGSEIGVFRSSLR